MIGNKVKDILKKNFGLMRVDDDLFLLQDFGMEPIEVMELLIALEEKLSIRMPSEAVANRLWEGNDMKVSDLVDFVEEYAPVNMVHPPKIPRTLEPVAGLYALTRKGTAICCLTGKRCHMLSKSDVRNNAQTANLCKTHRCAIEQNFQQLAQKVK